MVVSVVPSGWVMWRVPSGSMTSRIFGSWAARWWWYLHIKQQLVGVLGPPCSRKWMWWTSQWMAFVAAGPAAVLIAGGDGAEEGVGD